MALIPPFFPDCVVAIGTDEPGQGVQWKATGFLYGQPVLEGNTKLGYRVFLVTNQHVLQGVSNVVLRFNPASDGQAKDFPIPLIRANGPIWMGHPVDDVAVFPIDFDALRKYGVRAAFFHADLHSASREKLRELEVTEGDFVYVLGFPMGLVGEQRSTVVVRSGVIARLRDLLDGSAKTYLVDSSIFPGNSGGPVILKPELVSISGTRSQMEAYLIGIVRGYLPYRDVAISTQTRMPRVIFEENSGLAVAYAVDTIDETIDALLHQSAISEGKQPA